MELLKWVSVTDRYTKMHLDRMLEPLGLNSSQHMYIVRICREPGITQDRFCQLFHINPSNITRSLAALEKQGFLEKRANEKDKRTCCLYPTEKAVKASERIQAICAEWNDRLLGGLSEQEREQFLQLLRRVGEAAVEQTRLEWEALNEKGED